MPMTELLESQEQLSNDDTLDPQREENSLMTVIQKNNHLEAMVEDGDKPRGAVFFLGEGQEETESQSHRIQTPVEVHCSGEAPFQVSNGRDGQSDEEVSMRGLSDVTSDGVEERTGEDSEGERSPQEATPDVPLCVDTAAVLDVEGSHAGNSEHVPEDVCPELPENQHCELDSSPQDIRDMVEQVQAEEEESMKLESRETPAQFSQILGENDQVQMAPHVESSDSDAQLGDEQVEQVDLARSRGESDEEGDSLHSSNESIMKVTDEESECDEAEESTMEELHFKRSSSKEEALWSEGPNILDLHINGYPEEGAGDGTDTADRSDALDVNSAVKGADLAENSDFSILETSGSPGLSEMKGLEEEATLPGDCSEVEAC